MKLSDCRHLSLFHSTESNPYLNLALENQILQNVKENSLALFTYQNEKSVIMGRFQNPWLECNLAALKRDGVHLVRRQSGGGCVYNDLGNLNYSFISDIKLHKKEEYLTFLCESLRALGVSAFFTERSDIRVSYKRENLKFSGSAFKRKKNSAIQHGTLLIQSDLFKLNYYLRSKEEVLNSKSINSVRSQVCNLSDFVNDLTIERVQKQLHQGLALLHDKKVTTHYLTEKDLVNRDYFLELSSQSWLWESTPFCILKIRDIAEIEQKKGRIISLALNLPDLHPLLEEYLKNELHGKLLNRKDIVDSFEAFTKKYPEANELVLPLKEEILKLCFFGRTT